MIIIGYQLITFSAFAKTYAITHLKEKNSNFEKLFKYITIERAIVLGAIAIIASLFLYIIIGVDWFGSGFGELNRIKDFVIASTMLTVGVQTIFSSFMLSILGIKEK